MCGLARTLTKWNDWMEVNGGMTCKPKLPLLFSSHDDLRYSVSPGSCHPLWHRSHRRKSHIWHRRSHGLCDRPWRTLCTHLPHPPSYRCDSGTCRMKRTRTGLCTLHQKNKTCNNRMSFEYFYIKPIICCVTNITTFHSSHSKNLQDAASRFSLDSTKRCIQAYSGVGNSKHVI